MNTTLKTAAPQPGTTESDIPPPKTVADNLTNTCRICYANSLPLISIYRQDAKHNHLVDKINSYLPILITPRDLRPMGVCQECYNTILHWHELVEKCMETEKKLAKWLNVPPKIRHETGSYFIPCEPTDVMQPDNGTTKQITSPHIRLRSPCLFLIIKEVLNNYFKILNIDENNPDLIYACQICPEAAAADCIEALCEHLKSSHESELYDKESIEGFIKEYITFEEVLTNSNISDDEGESQKVTLPSLFCPFCDSAFSSPTRLICHMNKHIEVNFKDEFLCCDQLYPDKKSFVSHLQDIHVTRTLDAYLICKSCGFEAADNESLETHIKVKHFYEKKKKQTKPNPKCQKYIPAVCPECNKTFSNKYNMFAHIKNHDGGVTTKYLCEKCNKSYKSQGSLSHHRKVFHEGLLRFLCSMCGEAFPSRIARDTHTRIHTGLKPFICKYCNKSFRAQNTLDRHTDTHLNIRNYKCHVCEKKFRKKSHLDYHIKTHDRKK